MVLYDRSCLIRGKVNHPVGAKLLDIESILHGTQNRGMMVL